MTLATKCPACLLSLEKKESLGHHFATLSDQNDVGHIMWLNHNISGERKSTGELDALLRDFLDVGRKGLASWIKVRFIGRFYGESPHPFILALQHPSRAVLLGYVLEHQHFLKQWARTLSWVVAKSDLDEVLDLELENITTEFVGYGPERPSHYELLIRMGESLGMSRSVIMSTPPSPVTAAALKVWRETGETRHWLETMAAMHALELVANKDIKRDGAVMTYFDPRILEGSEVTQATKDFLMEGYEADVNHSEVPLALVERLAPSIGIVEDVQFTVLRSIDAFDRYLSARLERAMEFEPGLARFIA